MQNILETVSVVASLLVLFLVLFVVVVNLYFLKSNDFHVRVNCWFCNVWTKVPYSQKNCWDCPSCFQYNGFSEDGGYNKVIEAQHAVGFTRLKSNVKTEPSTNYLCTYCNNNQQLKVYQLAKFTPLNEDKYDIEIEHFQKQLEKAYKLCKKCESVLKTTLDRQHSWIFGNRLKSLKKKGMSLIDLTKSSQGFSKKYKQSIFWKSIRYTLILLSMLMMCNVLKIKVEYPSDMKVKLPEKYDVIINDLSEVVNNSSAALNKEIDNLNKYLPNYIKVHGNILVMVSAVGFLLQIILVLFDRRSKIWKTVESVCWLAFLYTTAVILNKEYQFPVNVCQVLCSLILCYSYMNSSQVKPSNFKQRNKFEFKKLRKHIETNETSEEELEEIEEEEENHLSLSDSSTKSFKDTLNHSRSYRMSSPITANYKKKSTSFNSNDSFHNDLNRSLDNLKLDRGPSALFSEKKPLLSPPKLNVTQNPWTAGGFWKNDFSRSSSQSSGFVSHHPDAHYNSLPASREPSLSGDVDRASILSEPAYHFQPVEHQQYRNGFTTSPQNGFTRYPQNGVSETKLYYRGDNNTFYPVLSQNNMLVLSCSPQGNLGGAFAMRSMSISPEMVICDKPAYNGLFKNINGDSKSFKKM
ncbi:unnamed protein product [Acanthoscelides obtectus]|uniref:Ima1 N-terminal domain-containing protein n=1 Tax=Acanthoscelides obtectus TaxID=200917 RepID=A0A9P0KXX1_ACAOB|nr:unnamed protein product [Acanthoscelides obtectus]CAK1620991.1 Transmembrane protein 201 [Acanthoscelides obtectus]